MVFIFEKLAENEFRVIDLVKHREIGHSLSDLNKIIFGENFRQKLLKKDEMLEWHKSRDFTPTIQPQNRHYMVITYDELCKFYEAVKEYETKSHFNTYIKYKFARLKEVDFMLERAKQFMGVKNV